MRDRPPGHSTTPDDAKESSRGKGSAVIDVLTESPKATWRKPNRHKALLTVGYCNGTHLHGTP
ncbi:hypothetical protein ACFWFU_05810 [Streptomyces sp. NPDC060235]|uniref:hypothetical protein n=1 Tax=Streptomyces sp. NPDC060235 TaxID=3347080 RepID=UPI00365F0821